MAFSISASSLTVLRSIGLNEKLRERVTRIRTELQPRSSSRHRLIRMSTIACGIELCYAACTSLMSPTLLLLGAPAPLMSLSWCSSPIIGFLLVPLLGSCSDSCSSSFGRRRPFILALAACILVGVALLAAAPNTFDARAAFAASAAAANASAAGGQEARSPAAPLATILLACLGVALLDSSCDACQSPARSYLLDSVSSCEHGAALSMFTLLAACGACCGYAACAIDWTSSGSLLANQRAVFSAVAVAFVLCVAATVTSVAEQSAIQQQGQQEEEQQQEQMDSGDDNSAKAAVFPSKALGLSRTDEIAQQLPAEISLGQLLAALPRSPQPLRLLCAANLLSCMSLCAYTLFFTDYVGQAVYRGSPDAAPWSGEGLSYAAGVQAGSAAMSLHSAVCCVYSLVIGSLVDVFGARRVYMFGCLLSAAAAAAMAAAPYIAVAAFGSACMGVLYATQFTVPYMLVASYHASDLFAYTDGPSTRSRVRSLSEHVALVSSTVFLAQLLVASCMGSLVHALGSTRAVCIVSAVCSLLAGIAGRFVLVLESDTVPQSEEQQPEFEQQFGNFSEQDTHLQQQQFGHQQGLYHQ